VDGKCQELIRGKLSAGHFRAISFSTRRTSHVAPGVAAATEAIGAIVRSAVLITGNEKGGAMRGGAGRGGARAREGMRWGGYYN
jgi:hypothetical protein